MFYICPTPIGNIKDITLRTIETLKSVDAIYAEDTRHTAILLKQYDIKTPLFSCHTHNESMRSSEIIKRLEEGENIAYVSDAGMPLISDPGARLVTACIESGQEFTVLPGASAAVTGVVLSGMAEGGFLFIGFLPRIGQEREDAINDIALSSRSIIIYESPLRIAATAKELAQTLGEERPCALVRELTKIHEEAYRSTLGDIAKKYETDPPRGECMLIIKGTDAPRPKAVSEPPLDIEAMRQAGAKPRAIARAIAERLNVKTGVVYDLFAGKE